MIDPGHRSGGVGAVISRYHIAGERRQRSPPEERLSCANAKSEIAAHRRHAAIAIAMLIGLREMFIEPFPQYLFFLETSQPD